MHEHPATQEAIQQLMMRDNIHIPAQEGNWPVVCKDWTYARARSGVDFIEKDLAAKMPYESKDIDYCWSNIRIYRSV